jgi:hypothetical protein
MSNGPAGVRVAAAKTEPNWARPLNRMRRGNVIVREVGTVMM